MTLQEAMNTGKPFTLHTEYEPRWHGYARIEDTYYSPSSWCTWAVRTLHRGWKRRPRGSTVLNSARLAPTP